MTERILHYPAAPTCEFSFFSYFGGRGGFFQFDVIAIMPGISFIHLLTPPEREQKAQIRRQCLPTKDLPQLYKS